MIACFLMPGCHDKYRCPAVDQDVGLCSLSECDFSARAENERKTGRQAQFVDEEVGAYR